MRRVYNGFYDQDIFIFLVLVTVVVLCQGWRTFSRVRAQTVDNFRRLFWVPIGILSSKMGSWNLALLLLLSLIILLLLYKLLHGVRTKQLKALFRNRFRQPITSHRFLFLYTIIQRSIIL
jgi:hypothetical protein